MAQTEKQSIKLDTLKIQKSTQQLISYITPVAAL